MATYPVFVVNFTTHKDGDVVASADPNSIQAEVTALETTLGAMPHVSTANASSGAYTNSAHTYPSVAARLANIEQGIVSDAHSQYLHLVGGDIIAPPAGVVGVTVKAPTAPTTPVFQVVNNAGAPVLYVDASLVPRVTGGAAVVDATSAQTLTNKTLTTPVIAQIVNTGTLSLPTSTDTLVGRNTTDTLANKTLSSPTLTTPTIADFTNSTHSHANPAGGSVLAQSSTHASADTDVATTSLHHTIGAGGSQAAAGNHLHAGVYQAAGSYANTSHTHSETDVTSLSADLSNRSLTGHTHGITTDTGWNKGQTGITTNASGQATIPHGLGSTPGTVVTTLLSSGSNALCTVFNLNATTFTVQIFHAESGAAWNAGGFTVNWTAYL